MSFSRSTARLIASLSATLLLLTACGIPLDDAPRAIDVRTTTTRGNDDSATNSTTASADGTVALYYLNDNLLTVVQTEGASRSPTQVLSALFAGVPARARTDVSTQIPNGTQLLGTVFEDGALTIDVSSEFDNLVGSGRTLALAQIVMTVTELEQVRSVSMRIDGVDVPIYSPEAGDTATVTDCDYRSLFPQRVGGMTLDSLTESANAQRDQGEEPVPDPEDLELSPDELHLFNRIVDLEQRCDPS